jgi:hypothetical protein
LLAKLELFSFLIGVQVFNRTNETIYAIWNTTAGGNSSPSNSSYYEIGAYWPTEPPEAAVDGNITTIYTNHGTCNITIWLITCGDNTGLYLTLNDGPFTLIAFYFYTNDLDSERDPLTITIEGSNLNGSALTLGSSWTLIYNGSSGLTSDPGRSAMGTLQILPNASIPFNSYRLLVTSKRGIETCTSYAEFVLIGN